MEKHKIDSGIFLMELVPDQDGISITLWVTEVFNPTMTKSFEFVAVEAESFVQTLDLVYQWIDNFETDNLGYSFTESEFVVFGLQEFVLLLGKQGEHSLWCRNFVDFVSYFAGSMGMSYAEASESLIKPLFGLQGKERYWKMTSIYNLLLNRAKSFRNILARMEEVTEVSDCIHKVMATSGLAENIWRKCGVDEPPKNH